MARFQRGKSSFMINLILFKKDSSRGKVLSAKEGQNQNPALNSVARRASPGSHQQNRALASGAVAFSMSTAAFNSQLG
jgi:hypothetical protein